ncbi:proline-rich protein 3 isoform X2 [Rhinolophus sinicus]|uniref:proline-rich protein 3 isoform X2 n=1 Tax=Rhinolophus sinicus TaxID=89399 RepID=UPI003D7BA589
MAGASAWGPQPPRKRKQNLSVPLPHCLPNPAAAIAATTMPKRKKQNQQQQQPPQQLPLLKREETEDEEDGISIAPNWNPPTCPPSLEWINKLLCVHAMGYYTALKMNELLLQATWMNLTNMMLSERIQTQKNADSLHRGPPGSRGPVIPPLLSLPPPPRGRGPVWGGLGPRFGPYGRGWWGINAEPPVPGPSHGPSRGGFHKEQRHPRRLKSWSLVKNTCPPKDGPQVKEDKSDRPVCRHFAKKGHCRYEDLCAFYHPGVNGPPL